MSEQAENSALQELLSSIDDRRMRRKVQKLHFFGSEAVQSLSELDSALYTREGGEEQMQIVADAVLSHVRRLLEYIGSISAPTATLVTGEFKAVDLDFDFGETGETVPGDFMAEKEPPPKSIEEKTDDEKWNELKQDLDSLQYGLGSELKEFDRRFSDALEHDRMDQALRDLNDATSSLQDGIFAVIVAAFERFLGRVDRETMIPGHRDTLGKALAVRRGLTALRQEVQELNRPLQDTSTNDAVKDMSYRLLVDALADFIGSETFGHLRPPDRKEFREFFDRLQDGNPNRNRMDCEGLDKYLDSLAVVSQRDVLIKHDKDLREQISANLENALATQGVEPPKLLASIHKAFAEADRLYGLIEDLDTIVYRWSNLGEDKQRDIVLAIDYSRELLGIVQLPKAAPPPAGDDFF